MKLYTIPQLIFIIWLLLSLFFFYFGFQNFPHASEIPSLTNALANWDGGHFMEIAEKGYTKFYQYAFFPLFPILIRFLGAVVRNLYLGAFLLNLLTTYFGVYLFYKLLQLDSQETTVKKAILFLLIFPTSFYLLTVYSESLFFFLSVGAFYFLRSSLGKVSKSTRIRYQLVCVLLTVLAGLTRIESIVLIVALFIEVWKNGEIGKRDRVLFLLPMGFMGYCVYLFHRTGNPFFFISAESYWQRSLSIPGRNFFDAIVGLSIPHFLKDPGMVFSDLVFSIFGLGMLLRSIRFLRPSYVVFGLGSILLPLFTNSLSSMPRFLLPIFPLFIVLSLVKKKPILITYTVVSLGLLILYSIRYINGYWVS